MLARAAISLTAALALAASTVEAQTFLNGLSSSCKGSVTGLFGSQLGACANIAGLLPLLTASGSVISPINSYLGNLCQQQNCSSAAISNATSIIDNGCSSELNSGNHVISVLRTAVANFNDVKAAACLQQTSNSTYCVTDLLDNLQGALNEQLTLTTVTSLKASSFQNVQPSAVCDDCAHALTTKLVPIFNTSTASLSRAAKDIGNYCGQSFLNGEIPSGVKESGVDATSSSGNGSGKSSGATKLGAASGIATLAVTALALLV